MEEINQQEVNNTIAKNLSMLRKKSGLTQLQLAEKINYSDKAISKWEKGDCVPNIYVLLTLAKFYGVDIKAIAYENAKPTPKSSHLNIKIIWSFLSVAIIFVLATLSFVILHYTTSLSRAWLCFIVALPVSFFTLTILCNAWKWHLSAGIFSSLFIWTSILAFSLIFESYKVWMVYILGAPLQVIVILLQVLNYIKHRTKKLK